MKEVLHLYRVPHHLPRDVGVALAYVCLYVVLDRLSFIHPWAGTAITPWNPPPALTLLLLLAFGLRFVPAVAVAVVAADMLLRTASVPLGYSIAGALVLACGYGVTAYVLTAGLDRAGVPTTVRQLARFLGVVMGAVLLIGALFVLVQVAAEEVHWQVYAKVLTRFWIGDVVGILVNLPLLLMLAHGGTRRRLFVILRSWEALLQGAAIVLALWLVFGLSAQVYVRYFYVLFLPIVWIAVRHGLAGAAPAIVMVQLGLVVAVEVRDPAVVTVLEMQAVMLALTITALMLGVAVDERARAQEELQQSLRLAAAGEMAGALGHELNQPVSAIVSYGKACELMLQAGDPTHPELPGTIRKLVEQSQRVGVIVRRLRDFLRSGKMELRETSLAAVVTGVAESFRRELADDSIALATEVPEGLAPVWMDRLEIEIVLRNLIANAADSVRAEAPPARSISIQAARHAPGFMRISVFDTGPGVPSAMRERLFAPFESSKAHGMGLGLAVSRAIVEAHGGRLWADATPFGAFHLTLPIHQGDSDDRQD